MDYTEFIEAAPLITDPQVTVTTGDPDYAGTAIEIRSAADVELFDIVVDRAGQLQCLFFATSAPYRMPLDVLERIVRHARETVRAVK